MFTTNSMVRSFNIPCNFNGQVSDVRFYIGEPNEEKNPIYFQTKWLGDTKGGSVPQDVIDSIEKIQKLAKQNNISFEDLCAYARSIAKDQAIEANPEFDRVLLSGN